MATSNGTGASAPVPAASAQQVSKATQAARHQLALDALIEAHFLSGSLSKMLPPLDNDGALAAAHAVARRIAALMDAACKAIQDEHDWGTTEEIATEIGYEVCRA